MPSDHHSPPEAAQQVHTELAVNLHHSNPLHSPGLQQNQAPNKHQPLGIPLAPPAHRPASGPQTNLALDTSSNGKCIFICSQGCRPIQLPSQDFLQCLSTLVGSP